MAKVGEVEVGDKVTTTAKYEMGTNIPLCSFVRETTYDVIQVGGKNLPKERIVIGLGKEVTAAVHISSITVIKKKNSTTKTTVKKNDSKPKGTSVDDVLNSINKIMSTTTVAKKDKMVGNSGAQTQIGVAPTTGGKMTETYKIPDPGTSYIRREVLDRITGIEKNSPKYAQWGNPYNFPHTKGMDPANNNAYMHDYYMDYWSDKTSDNITPLSDMTDVYQSSNMNIRGKKLYQHYLESYNRYKTVYADDFLSKSFGHVFFVRPDCYLGTPVGNNHGKFNMLPALTTLPEFYYANKHCPELLAQLTHNYTVSGNSSDFMMYLSNKARTFEVSDEHIMTDTYGQGLTGYKIPYGKDNVASRTSDKFTISYIDDRDAHIYHLHKLWIDYISYVYRGKLAPCNSYNVNKIIDYATCVYYILCAEDGETIIFWSKYWGVFPLDAPSSAFSYSADNPGGVSKPELRIEYQYAWKEDFNPLILVEFNENSRIGRGSFSYSNTYQPAKIGTGYSWSPRPFIETYKSATRDAPYTFKLRFKEPLTYK